MAYSWDGWDNEATAATKLSEWWSKIKTNLTMIKDNILTMKDTLDAVPTDISAAVAAPMTWRNIISYTTTATTAAVTFNVDSSASAFSLRKIIIIIETPTTATEYSAADIYAIINWATTTAFDIGQDSLSYGTGTGGSTYIEMTPLSGINKLKCRYASSALKGNFSIGNITSSGISMDGIESCSGGAINSITLSVGTISAKEFIVGTTFKIYGINA